MNSFEAAIEITKIEFERLKELKKLDSLDVVDIFKKALLNVENNKEVKRLKYDNAILNVSLISLRTTYVESWSKKERDWQLNHSQIKRLNGLGVYVVGDLIKSSSQNIELMTGFQNYTIERLKKAVIEMGVSWE